jgi:hypothetical protein
MKIRKPAVAGTFYPDSKTQLTQEINQLLNKQVVQNNLIPKAMILPHAGIMYSGEVAAAGYNLISQIKQQVKQVVLLGPSHYVAFSGIATSDCDAFITPLGVIPLATDLAQSLATKFHQVAVMNDAHEREHSLEVHCPFLQCTLDEFTLLPLTVGDCSVQQVAEVIEFLWQQQKNLIIISSDLSHYHSYEEAIKLDNKTAEKILNFDTSVTPDQACGCYPVNGMLAVAKNNKLSIKKLLMQNSGDTSGDKFRVVGYGAFALYG